MGHYQDYMSQAPPRRRNRTLGLILGGTKAGGWFIVWRRMTLFLSEIKAKVTGKEAEEVAGKLQPSQEAAGVTWCSHRGAG